MLLRYTTGETPIDGTGNAVSKKFSGIIITKILPEFMEQMGEVFAQILFTCMDNGQLFNRRLQFVARQAF